MTDLRVEAFLAKLVLDANQSPRRFAGRILSSMSRSARRFCFFRSWLFLARLFLTSRERNLIPNVQEVQLDALELQRRKEAGGPQVAPK